MAVEAYRSTGSTTIETSSSGGVQCGVSLEYPGTTLNVLMEAAMRGFYLKRRHTTPPLRLGSPVDLYSYVAGPALPDQVGKIALKHFELITTSGEYYANELEQPMRGFNHAYNDQGQEIPGWSFIGGSELWLNESQRATLHFHLAVSKVTGLLTGDVHICPPSQNTYVPIESVPTLSHVLIILDLIIQTDDH